MRVRIRCFLSVVAAGALLAGCSVAGGTPESGAEPSTAPGSAHDDAEPADGEAAGPDDGAETGSADEAEEGSAGEAEEDESELPECPIVISAGAQVPGEELFGCFQAVAEIYDTVQIHSTIDHPIAPTEMVGSSSYADPYMTRFIYEPRGVPGQQSVEHIVVDESHWISVPERWTPVPPTDEDRPLTPWRLAADERQDMGEWELVSGAPQEHNGYQAYEWTGVVEDLELGWSMPMSVWLTAEFLLAYVTYDFTHHGVEEYHEFNYFDWGEADPPDIPEEFLVD